MNREKHEPTIAYMCIHNQQADMESALSVAMETTSNDGYRQQMFNGISKHTLANAVSSQTTQQRVSALSHTRHCVCERELKHVN